MYNTNTNKNKLSNSNLVRWKPHIYGFAPIPQDQYLIQNNDDHKFKFL
jgi:hypothetical protein